MAAALPSPPALWWAEALRDAPHHEPDIPVDWRCSRPAANFHSTALPLPLSDVPSILAAYAVVLARAVAHPEPCKELLIGMWTRAHDTWCLCPVRLIVDEARSFDDLRAAAARSVQDAESHVVTEAELRGALGRAEEGIVRATILLPDAAAAPPVRRPDLDVELRLCEASRGDAEVPADEFDGLAQLVRKKTK